MPSVAQIDGLNIPGGAPAFTGLLDETYGSGAAAGYSVRRLATSATVLMRVRRETAGGTGDDDEADVAYDSNNILSLDSAISNASAGVTATTLGQFINVGTVNGTTYTNPDSLTVTASCLVDTWMDQSGNGNDAEQTAQGAQPQIHAGTVDTDLILENGKPAVDFDGSSDEFPLPLSGLNINNLSVSTVCQSDITSGDAMQFSLNKGTDERYWHFLSNGFDTTWYGGTIRIVHGAMDTSQRLRTIIAGSTSGRARSFLNGTEGPNSLSLVNSTLNANEQVLGNYHTGSFYWDGTMQEFIVWGADQFNNRTDIEDNINSDYLIYQPTDQPTSGLLYDYGSATGGTDAAAAYSVRQLSDKAVLCMRIRRDMGAGNPGDDDETNIGFDANGDLDTQAISDFCGTGTGWVTRWWDQSVNGNHADQPVGGTGSNGDQPQIYDGTTVIEENGKPALDFNADFF